MIAPSTLIVGIGSPHGGDAVGWAVARAIERVAGPATRCVAVQTPLDLLDLVTPDVTRLVIIDACAAGGRVGDVRRVDWNHDLIESAPSAASHGWGVRDALLLLQRLHRLPQNVEVVAIEVGTIAAGGDLSPQLRDAANRVAAEVLRAPEIASHA